MSSWDIPPQKPKMTDIVDNGSAQELLLGTYIEEQDRWNKSMMVLEAELITKERELKVLVSQKDKWWEVILFKMFKRLPKRIVQINAITSQVGSLNTRYGNLMKQMPKIDAYEFAMYGTKMFRIPK